MSFRPRQSLNRPACIALVLIYACAAVAVLCAGTAHAAVYKMVLCAANNGVPGYATATNTNSPQNPGGIFSFENYCGPAPYPAGNGAHLRIVETQPSGSAGVNAYGSMSWTTPSFVDIRAGGGYTRIPNAFNDGWRGRFWLEGWDGSTNNVLVQGSGVANNSCGGVCWATTPVFAPHLWPFGGYGSYRRFVFELTCMRPAGCDRANFNAVDANTMVLMLDDVDPSHINFTNTGSSLMAGRWVRGPQDVTWDVSDQGSGMRFERLRVDGGQQTSVDWRGSCNIDANGATGEFARDFRPCPTGGPWGRTHRLETSSFADGAHTIEVCSQDYGQSVAGQESCDRRNIRVDNTVPGKPAELKVTSANPARYLDHFGAGFSLPPNQGSPITKVHYDVVDPAGKVVMPEKILSATNPTLVPTIEGPPKAAELNLRVWLEDEVGFVGQPAVAAIPRDTTPPAAPQEVSVTAPTTSRAAQGFDVRWRNVVDSGSPIDRAHYQLLNAAGGVVVPTQTIDGANIEAIQDLATPLQRGKYTLKLWLEDAEGNVGVPTTAPLAYECVRSDVSGGTGLTSGLGDKGVAEEIVDQGEGAALRGRLTNAGGGGVADAPLCVFSRVVTKGSRDFLGVAVTGSDGDYQFGIPAGPSREVGVAYRSGSREVSSRATLETIVHPTFKVTKKVVHNKHYAKFTGSLPGPDNNEVLVVAQVRRGKGWLAFHRYRTRNNGEVTLVYKFNKTLSPTRYQMRLQVRSQSGYPYRQGNSSKLTLIVLPTAAHQHGDGRR